MDAILALFFFRLSSRQPRTDFHRISSNFLIVFSDPEYSPALSELLLQITKQHTTWAPRPHRSPVFYSRHSLPFYFFRSPCLRSSSLDMPLPVDKVFGQTRGKRATPMDATFQRTSQVSVSAFALSPTGKSRIKNCVQNQLHSEKSILIILFFPFFPDVEQFSDVEAIPLSSFSSLKLKRSFFLL